MHLPQGLRKGVKDTFDTTGKVIKPVFHYGFIPLIIYLGVKSEPSASFMQLLTL